MVDRWAAEHSDLRIVKPDYDSNMADRARFDLVGMPMLELLDGDKIISEYGQNAQKVTVFVCDRLEGWFKSVRGKFDTRSQ
jgi:hypothetical protein